MLISQQLSLLGYKNRIKVSSQNGAKTDTRQNIFPSLSVG